MIDALIGLMCAPCPLAPGAVADVPTLYITLMDTVSCRVLHRTTHFHAMAPVSLLLVENWVLYSYWNTRAQRTEVRRTRLAWPQRAFQVIHDLALNTYTYE